MIEPAERRDASRSRSQYHSNNPNDDILRNWLGEVVNNEVRTPAVPARPGSTGPWPSGSSQPVMAREPRAGGADAGVGVGAGAVKSAAKVDQIRTAAVPPALMFIMFFVIMTSAPQLLNSVIEEKMSRISEVMLGSITPFELMMGKLLGNAGIAMLLARSTSAEASRWRPITAMRTWSRPGLIAALVFFLILAILLYGSLYMAVGSACSELKDAQSLMMPVMLLSMLPMFVWTAVLKNPSSPLSVGMSLFPPASPFLMLDAAGPASRPRRPGRSACRSS